MTQFFQDYARRLVSVSWHFLDAQECQRRAERDIEPEFSVNNLNGGAGDGTYFDPAQDVLAALAGRDDVRLLDALQIDLLRPTFDYYALKFSSMLTVLVQIEWQVIEFLQKHDYDVSWAMIGFTTADDSPVSALRRTIVFPARDLDGAPLENVPRATDIPLHVLFEMENYLQDYFMRSSAAAYPGTAASAWQVLQLAEEYHHAHNVLVTRPNSELPHASAPARLLAIHASELYLNVFLLVAGMTPEAIRGCQHDLGKRTELALAHGLAIETSTASHLMALTASREYLSARYGPELWATWSDMGEIAKTLDELFKQVAPVVHEHLARQCARPRTATCVRHS